jgi:hypothetical protein
MLYVARKQEACQKVSHHVTLMSELSVFGSAAFDDVGIGESIINLHSMM